MLDRLKENIEKVPCSVSLLSILFTWKQRTKWEQAHIWGLHANHEKFAQRTSHGLISMADVLALCMGINMNFCIELTDFPSAVHKNIYSAGHGLTPLEKSLESVTDPEMYVSCTVFHNFAVDMLSDMYDKFGRMKK